MSYWKSYKPSWKNSGHYKVGLLLNNYFWMGILGILYPKIGFNSEFGQVLCIKGVQNDSCQIYFIIFGHFYQFLQILEV
jgi:hypothetical protein